MPDFKSLAATLLEVIRSYRRLLIYIKGSPDPDAIGAAYGLKLLCDELGTESEIVSPQGASLPQNIKLIKDLNLPVHFKPVEECKKNYDAYTIVDHQSIEVEGVTGVIPCAIHVDHHEAEPGELSVGVRVHSDSAGSSSTLLVHLLKKIGTEFRGPEWRNAATAMYYGIQTDTDDFRQAGKIDHSAVRIISPYVNKHLLGRINALPFTREAIQLLHQAIQDQLVYEDWLITGIGYINEKYRDTMGIIGDFLLKWEETTVVVVFGIVEGENSLVLNASFRSKDENLNLNGLIKKITRQGGARKFKGAFQVNLDYFLHCPDRDQLWQSVYATTVETLKKRRDEAAIELNTFLRFFKRRIKGSRGLKMVDRP